MEKQREDILQGGVRRQDILLLCESRVCWVFQKGEIRL